MDKQMQTLCNLDWLVLTIYALSMLYVGWHFSRRSHTMENYMLGGRRMKSWTVGLSLFATMLSAISYMAWPGEMIKHGPVVFCGLIAYPVFSLVIGWLIIPSIMKQNVGSAYELLEKRLGVSVRVLASLFFLSLRIIWMSVIIYMVAYKVILPLMGWPTKYGLVTCVVLGSVTVIYTSLGGLRAVVVTDVAQTFILLGGAVLSMILITKNLGGVTAWWPDKWANNWEKFQFWPTVGSSPGTSRTILGAFIATFSWYVCTAGSDQMAIQRYLCTRDAKSARRAFLISICTDVFVTVFLGIMGLALLAFYQAHPEKLPPINPTDSILKTETFENNTHEHIADVISSDIETDLIDERIKHNADKLFPRFIIVGLPAGFSGLVLAGLLAAAMSSLSSGINSSCLVITEDFIGRFRKKQTMSLQKVKLAKYISLAIGGTVVLLSCVVGNISGNIFEVAHKTANLLVAPLFVPFFMAIFVRKAKSWATCVGMVASVLAAVCIGYWLEIRMLLSEILNWEMIANINGLGFLWIMPVSFVVGVLVSWILSILSQDRVNLSS